MTIDVKKVEGVIEQLQSLHYRCDRLSAGDIEIHLDRILTALDDLPELLRVYAQWEALRTDCFVTEPTRFPCLRDDLFDWMLEYNRKALRAAVGVESP